MVFSAAPGLVTTAPCCPGLDTSDHRAPNTRKTCASLSTSVISVTTTVAKLGRKKTQKTARATVAGRKGLVFSYSIQLKV